jgi:hypothetical protein
MPSIHVVFLLAVQKDHRHQASGSRSEPIILALLEKYRSMKDGKPPRLPPE